MDRSTSSNLGRVLYTGSKSRHNLTICTFVCLNICYRLANLYFLVHLFPGLKEYIEANPSLKVQSSTAVVQSKVSDVSISNSEYEEKDVRDEFYDAISADSSSEEEESDDEEPNHKVWSFTLTRFC